MDDPFITLEELGAYLSPRAPRDLTGDVLATLAIDAACSTIRTRAEQELDLSDSTIAFSGDGIGRELLLPQLPVVAVDEVRIDGEVTLDWELRSDGVLRRTTPSVLDPEYPLTPYAWPRGNANVEVDYSHGYDPIPSDLRLLALTLAARAYEQGLARQESTGSTSVTYSVPSSLDLSSGELALVAKYRHPKAPTVVGPAVS